MTEEEPSEAWRSWARTLFERGIRPSCCYSIACAIAPPGSQVPSRMSFYRLAKRGAEPRITKRERVERILAERQGNPGTLASLARDAGVSIGTAFYVLKITRRGPSAVSKHSIGVVAMLKHWETVSNMEFGMDDTVFAGVTAFHFMPGAINADFDRFPFQKAPTTHSPNGLIQVCALMDANGIAEYRMPPDGMVYTEISIVDDFEDMINAYIARKRIGHANVVLDDPYRALSWDVSLQSIQARILFTPPDCLMANPIHEAFAAAQRSFKSLRRTSPEESCYRLALMALESATTDSGWSPIRAIAQSGVYRLHDLSMMPFLLEAAARTTTVPFGDGHGNQP